MTIKKVGVIGCGLMGHGIAQVSASGGFETVVCETEQKFLDSGFKRIEGSLAKLVEKQKLTAEQSTQIRGRLKGTTSFNDLADCDLVVEAIVENLDTKKKLFADLGKICKPTTVFASNTSSFPIGEMGDASGRPQRMVGLHFFNPVQLMKLVEVVRTAKTTDEVFAEVRAFGEAVGKVPVACKDTPGFVVNRLLVPYMLDAIRMLERGDASKEDIDNAMMYGCGYPMGPITLTDYVGLDTTLFIVEGWHKRFPQEPTFVPPKLLADLVKKGHFGRKSGRGFYEWEGDKKK